MNRRTLGLGAAVAVLGLPALVHAQAATGLTSTGSLYNFAVTNPAVGVVVPVTGLTAGDALLAIDFRPADQQLVGVGYNSTAGTARVYAINRATGAATSINANTLTFGAGLARITADFNPTANAVRVVTSGATGNDLRIPTGGTGALATDTDLNPANTGIRSTAYSRNTAGGGTSGATTLYEIDGTNNALVTQGSVDFFTGSGTSPNTGTLSNVATLSGVTGSSVVGFDIYGGGTASPGTAYVATGTNLFTLNLSTGAATAAGAFTGVTLVDVAIPEPASAGLLGVAAVAGLAARRRPAAV